jgi:hypothetical protein
MGRTRRWVIGVAVAGTAASLIAAGLLWLLVTHPIAVAQALAKGL